MAMSGSTPSQRCTARIRFAKESGAQLMKLLEMDIKPLDIRHSGRLRTDLR